MFLVTLYVSVARAYVLMVGLGIIVMGFLYLAMMADFTLFHD